MSPALMNFSAASLYSIVGILSANKNNIISCDSIGIVKF